MTLTKDHLTDSVHKELRLPKSKSFGQVGSLFEIMKATPANGDIILESISHLNYFYAYEAISELQ
jgi:hypothetical protein